MKSVSISAAGFGALGLLTLTALGQSALSLHAIADARAASEDRVANNLALDRELALGGAGVSLLIAALAGWTLRRRVLDPLSQITNALTALAERRTQFDVPALNRGDEIGVAARALASAKDVMVQAVRAEAAIGDSTSAFLIADAEARIAYINKCFLQVLRARADEIKKQLPRFDPENLIGQSMDVFHKSPGIQRALVENLRGAHQTMGVGLGGLIYDLTVWPVSGRGGERLGFVLQWVDRTAERAAQSDIENVVRRASAGDFSSQVSLEGKEGFFRTLAEQLNALVASVQCGLVDVQTVLRALAEADLTARVEADHTGAFGELKNNANATTEKLADLVERLRAASTSLRETSGEILAGANDLSDRTTRQAATIEETSAAMEELSRTVADNAERAQRARSAAAQAQSAAEQGGDVMNAATAAMDRIVHSSQKISEIISLIDDIAFQTNLLALNASVEAARAGEAGKGFAVVASEVRRLAQSAAQASQEVKALIETSVANVREGVELVSRSSQGLGTIEGAVRDVADLMNAIAEASREQASGLQEVNVAVKQMDKITQQNAALAEETNAAVSQADVQARELEEIVGVFRVARAAPAPKPAVTPRQLQSRLRRAVAGGGGGKDDWSEF